MSKQALRIERDGMRATVVMARPAVRNAFNATLIEALRDAFATAKALIAQVAALDPDAATAFTTRAIARARTAAEGQEGLRAFLERRSAGWRAP